MNETRLIEGIYLGPGPARDWLANHKHGRISTVGASQPAEQICMNITGDMDDWGRREFNSSTHVCNLHRRFFRILQKYRPEQLMSIYLLSE
jgi:hypothetical protein